ncbi:hypothetical protein JL100_023255 [Skermanella mucosa]|uniref:hypothetical protein n=1 Tax=Skermanella mucosa TaxID=1789672 RepID=UPI00192A8893|nr:hypothetical protein [Skermanella mucosa]UEM19967.1 hypothetical protein JL100_023255 [Skermanella mucosa]
MESCIACGASTDKVELLPTYDADVIGIPVTLRNGVLRHSCDSCGFEGIELVDSENLSAAVAVARILLPVRLTGDEIRFLRKACRMNGKQFAAELGNDNTTLSRWENGTPIGDFAERSLRDTVWSLLYKRVPAIQVEPGHFKRMEICQPGDGQPTPRLVLERVRLKDAARRTKTDEWDIFDDEQLAA